MTPPLSPVNIAAIALQVLVIVGAGALLLRAFRIDAPRAVLAYWRILLLAIEQKIAGDVQVEMTLDEHGEVSDARVLSGPGTAKGGRSSPFSSGITPLRR